MIALNDRVICKMANMPEKTKGGIYLPQEKVQDGMAKINIGRVEAAGPGLTLRTGEFVPVNVKKGDVVVWEQFGGLRFEILGPRMVCVRAEDLGSILEKHEYDDGWFEDYKEGESPEEQKNKMAFAEKEKMNMASWDEKNIDMCDCKLLCQECGYEMDYKLKFKDKWGNVDDSSLPDCEKCKKQSMKVSVKKTNVAFNISGGMTRLHR